MFISNREIMKNVISNAGSNLRGYRLYESSDWVGYAEDSVVGSLREIKAVCLGGVLRYAA